MFGSSSVRRNLYRPRLPFRLGAWNVLVGDSKASQKVIIRDVLSKATAECFTVVGHFPAGDSRIGMPILNHMLIDIYADQKRVGLLSSHYPAFQYNNEGVLELTLRSFQTGQLLVRLTLPPNDSGCFVLHIWPARDWFPPIPIPSTTGRYEWTRLDTGNAHLVRADVIPSS